MSLDFSVERMKNFEVLSTIVYPPLDEGGEEQHKWHPVTDALIWATMAIGMGRITEENWEEFYKRLNILERATGAFLWRGKHPKGDLRNNITPLEVYMHIGLSTNASNMTDAQFRKHVFELLERNVNSEALKKAPEVYAELGLDTITKDEWQSAFRISFDDNKDLRKRMDVEALVRQIKFPNAHLAENIDSTTM